MGTWKAEVEPPGYTWINPCGGMDGDDDEDEPLRGTNSGALALSRLKDEFLERDGSDDDDED